MKKKLATFLRWLPVIATAVLIIAVEKAPAWAHYSHHAKVKTIFIVVIAGVVLDLIVIAVTRPLMPKQQPQTSLRRRTRRA